MITKKYLITFSTIVLLLSMVTSCKASPTSDLTRAPLIPLPLQLTATYEMFELTKNTNIVVDENKSSLKTLGSYLAGILKPATGFTLETGGEKLIQISPCIVLALDESLNSLGAEGYKLDIQKKEY